MTQPVQVSPAQLGEWVSAVRSADANAPLPLVLDVREPWECAQASIQANGFELVNIPMGDIVARLNELDPDRPVACLCHHGMRSMSVANYLLQRASFEQVANITGGIDAWSRDVDADVPRY
jgi:rhodanese-related sulfurtransferase